jgi:hypothetical protein
LLWSFNHDAGKWEVIGTGTVSEDGKVIVSDEGVGILAPGWHFTQPGTPTDGPDDPPCLDTGEIIETVVDAGQAAANCAKNFSDVRKSIEQIYTVASEIRNLVSSAQKILEDIEKGTLNTASGVANALAGINAGKTAVVNIIDLFKKPPSPINPINPIDNALKISRCIGESIGFAENLCNRLNTPNSPCSGPVVTFICVGLAAASSILDKVNNLIAQANEGLGRLSLALLYGISDLAEIQQGLDPLGGQSFPTGIISSLPLQGEAKAVVVEGLSSDSGEQTAYVATGSYGLAIVDASQFNNPIILGQLDLPGDATDVAVDANSQIAAVATNDGGLHLIDVSDPMQPSLIQTIDISASQVEVADGIVYATVGNSLRTIDLVNAGELQNLALPGNEFDTVTDIARDGTNLYAFSSGSDNFSIIDIANEGEAVILGNVVVDVASSDVGVFAANGIAYLAGSGLRSVDISNPSNPTLIGDTQTFFTARDITLNGSGLGLVAAEDQGLGIYDITDPTKTDAIFTQIDTPGFVEDVAIASGIAFVADGSSDLQVINYLAFDNQGQAPTVTVDTAEIDADPDTEGVQVVEGSTIFLSADILVEDTFAPQITSTNPTEALRTRNIPEIAIRFDEAIDPESIDLTAITLKNLGEDEVVGGGDDTVFAFSEFQLRNFDRTLVLLPPEELTPGNYELKLNPNSIADRAGNLLTEAFTSQFTKRPQSIGINLGEIIEDSIVVAGEDQIFTFSATSGDRIYYDGLFGDSALATRLLSPSGLELFNNSTTSSGKSKKSPL